MCIMYYVYIHVVVVVVVVVRVYVWYYVLNALGKQTCNYANTSHNCTRLVQ